MFEKKNFFVLSFLLIILFLSACSKEIELPEKRALARWNALIEKNWELAYSYETPGYRKNFSLDQYKNRFGGLVSWKEIKLIKVSYTNDNVAEVTLDLLISFSPPGGGDILMPGAIKEKWLLQDNQWWFVPKK